MSEVDDTKQLHGVTPRGQAVTLTELRDHLRSFVTQLDDAPSEPAMLPWLPHREDSPYGEGCSPASHTPQTPGSASAAFAKGTGFLLKCHYMQIHLCCVCQ